MRLVISTKPPDSFSDSIMQLARRIRNGCWITGLAVGLLAYVLLLQGLASAYAKTITMIGESDPGFIICAPSWTDYNSPEGGLEFLGKDCCAAFCKAAASSGPTLEPVSVDLLSLIPQTLRSERMQPLEKSVPPKIPFVPALGARAPPTFSV